MSNQVIIDVREADEYQAERILGSLHIPLAQFQTDTVRVFRELPEDTSVLIMCRSGKRAALARDHVKALGVAGKREVSIYAGGILEWKKQSLPTETVKEAHFPIMRQIQLVAGSLVLASITLGYWVNPAFLLLGAFVGAGLTLAGATGFCGMAILLSRAPWNRVSPGADSP